MSVSLADVDYVAALAKLSFSADEKMRLTEELNRILEYMDQLRTLDTAGVEPLEQVTRLETILREDLLRPGLSHQAALANAPSPKEDFFGVPKTIGDR